MPRVVSQSTLALAAALLALLIAAILWFIPYLTREREVVSSVAAAPPVAAVQSVGIKPGEQACVDELTFDEDSQVVELTAMAGKRPGPPLELTAAAGSYRARASVDGGYDRPAPLHVPLDPPGSSAIGTLCIRNAGRSPVALLATSDARTSSLRSTTRVDGEAVPEDISMRLLASDGGSVVDRAAELVTRVAAFKPALLGTGLIWLVALLVAGGVAAGALYALASSFRESD